MTILLLFSGQGLQKPEHIDQVRQIASPSEYQLLQTALPDLFGTTTDAIDIYHNLVAQPLIYALQYVRWREISAVIETPIAFAGYSLGEASAYCCSSEIDFAQGLAIIQTRAKLMQDDISVPCGMLAIQGLNQSQLAEVLTQSQTFLAIQMTATQVIIGGYQQNLQQAAETALKLGASSIHCLNVSIPSHTPLIHTANQAFYSYLCSLNLPNAKVPIVSTTEDIGYTESQQAIRILSHQLDHPLDWQRCMATIAEYQPDIILEIGPGNALSRMINALMPHVPCRSYDDFRAVSGIKQWLDRNSH